MITQEVITEDERRCLRMWFRQAIAQLEQEEVTAAIKAEHGIEDEKAKHRTHPIRRRTRRSKLTPHLRELVY